MGGRVAKAMPMLGRVMRVLNVKSLLVTVDGGLKLFAPARVYSKGLERIREEVSGLATVDRLAVIHTRVPARAAGFADVLAETSGFPREKIPVLETGPALSCHAGPRVIGAFVVSDAFRDQGRGGGG